MPFPLRSTFPLRLRFAALVSGLLIASVLVFGGVVHWEMRQTALRMATLRLQTVSQDLARIVEDGAATLRSQLTTLAARPLIREAFMSPDGDSANALISRTTRPTLAVQMFDANGTLLRGSTVPNDTIAFDVAALIVRTTDSTRAATGLLGVVGDSVAYPTIVRVQDGRRMLGFLVYWRRLTNSDESRRQLSRLVGSEAKLFIGNSRGDLWTDLVSRTAPPSAPIPAGAPAIHDQERPEGRYLATAVPLTSAPWLMLVEFPYDQILSDLPHTLLRLTIAAAVLLLVGIGGAWHLSHNVTRPIADLAEATKAIQGGDFSRRVLVRHGDELGVLAEHFNEMAGTIASSRGEVERQLGRLKALRAIDLAILGTTDLQLLLRSVLAQVTAQLQSDVVALFLLNPHTLTVDTSASLGYRTREAEREKVRLGDGVAGKAARERRTVAVPHLSQVEMSDHLRSVANAEAIVSVYAVPLIAKGQMIGVLNVMFRTPFAANDDWLEFCEALAGQAAMAIDSCKSFEHLQRSNVELSLAYDRTIEGWSRALDLRDHETEGHSQRVTETTLYLARLAGMSDSDLVHVRRGALLHDIGKMAIPDSILLKPGRLDAEEWTIMRKHPQYAYELLMPIPYLRPALDIPYCHHEHWDGSGYPQGLKGTAIPQAARLFSVVDVWDALRSNRPYRPAWTEDRVCEYLRAQSGTQLDPVAVDLFFRALADGSINSPGIPSDAQVRVA